MAVLSGGGSAQVQPIGGAITGPQSLPALLGAGGLGSVVAAESHSGEGAERQRAIRRRIRCDGCRRAGRLIAGGDRLREPVGQRRHGRDQPGSQ